MKKSIVIAFAVLLVLSSAGLASAANAVVHFIDVGLGDAIYISLPNRIDILIDAGDTRQGAAVVKYLKDRKVDDIDLLIATHMHYDHIGGIPAVLKAFKTKKIIENGRDGMWSPTEWRNFRKAVEAAKKAYKTKVYVARGQSFKFGSASFKLLKTGKIASPYENAHCIVTALQVAGVDFLFAADADTEEEPKLIGLEKVNILKVGHHGSSQASTQKFLNKVHPKTAIISCGTGYDPMFPDPQTLKKLAAIGAKIYRTDLDRTIKVSVDHGRYKVSTQR